MPVGSCTAHKPLLGQFKLRFYRLNKKLFKICLEEIK